MLDSGASATVLDRRFAARLGLIPKGELTGEGAGGSTTYGLVQGVDLQLGDLEWKGGAGVAIDLAAVERQVGHPLPVILGGDLFRHAVVDIDFRARRIAFHEPSAYVAAPDARTVALSADGENLTISALVEGRPARLIFDLGNAGALDLFPRFWQRDFAYRPSSTTLTGGVGGMHVERVAMIRSVDLGGVSFADVPARLDSAQYSSDARSGLLDGNIGMDVLDRFHLTVDVTHKRVLFAPPTDTATAFRVNHGGLTMQPGLGGATVLYVAPGSPAAAAGVTVGAVIVAVDGSDDAAARDGWQYGRVGRTVRLRLRDGQVLPVTLARYF